MAETDSKPYGVIYCITNTVNGKCYVGQTTMDMERRWRCHCKSRSSKTRIWYAIEKHGRDAFHIEVIALAASKQELNALEVQHIAARNSVDASVGYNVAPGGGGSGPRTLESVQRGASQIRGRKMSEEQVEKMAATKRGRPRTASEQAVLDMMKELRTGQKHTAESRKKMSEANTGRKRPTVTDETRAKLAESARRQWEQGRGHSPKRSKS